MKSITLLFAMIIPAISFAQIEAGFLLNQKDIKLSGTKYVFEPMSQFSSLNGTNVGVSGTNSTDRVMKNTWRGVFLSTSMGQTTVKGEKIDYPTDVVEAFIPHPNYAIYAKINQCKNALQFLGESAKGVRDYLNTKEYKTLAQAKSQDLFALRNKQAKEFKLEVAKEELFVPDQLNLFDPDDSKHVTSRSGFDELGSSLDNITKLTMGCGALEAATEEVNAGALPEGPNSVRATNPPVKIIK